MDFLGETLEIAMGAPSGAMGAPSGAMASPSGAKLTFVTEAGHTP